MAGKNDASLWHHLIFTEKLESDEENKAFDCWVCKQTVSGCPAYKCLECNFLIHQLCTETEPTNMIHDLGERHHLLISKDAEKKKVVCSVCEQPVLMGMGPAYKCSIPICDLLLHQSCLKIPRVIKQHPLHTPGHPLILQKPFGHNKYCVACRKRCTSNFFIYQCSSGCYFVLHVKCAFRWYISPDRCHEHAYVPILKPIQFTCEACGEEEHEGPAYVCSKCRVLVQSECAKYRRSIDIKEHHHSLICKFSLHQVKKRKCKLCYKKVDTRYAAYCCQECSYILHLWCGNRIRKSSSGNPYHWSNLPSYGEIQYQEMQHFSHPHKLILSNDVIKDDKRCAGCMQFIISTNFYTCAQCNFSLHILCAKLTEDFDSSFHNHPLTLSMDGLFYCRACLRHRHGFTYKCGKCSTFNLDIECCLFPYSTITHRGHYDREHDLLLKKNFLRRCNACGDQNNTTFGCTTCKFFILCIRCATLLSQTKYGTHILTLIYEIEDSFVQNYCQICKEEIKPDHWVYDCDE